MFTTGFNEGINVLIKFTNGRSKVGRVSDYKSRFRKSRANTNKMNFPTINESIILRENSAAPQRTEEDQINTTDVRGSRGFDGSKLRTVNSVTQLPKQAKTT